MWEKHNNLIYEKDIHSACSGVLYTLQISLCEHLTAHVIKADKCLSSVHTVYFFA